MSKAKILSADEQNHLFEQIKKSRHPEKNKLIMLLSFRLGLKVQEIASLRLNDVINLNKTDFKTKAIALQRLLTVPKINKSIESKTCFNQTSTQSQISLKAAEFDDIVNRIKNRIIANKSIDATEFYPKVRKYSSKARDLPLIDDELCQAIQDYLKLRLNINSGYKQIYLKNTEPLILSQKGGSYSPNTLQEHMALMIRNWAGIKNGKSHSGRRTVLNDIINHQKKPLKIAQEIAGHSNVSTTLTYSASLKGDITESLRMLNSGSSIISKKQD